MKKLYNIILISFFAISTSTFASSLPQNIANLVEDSASAVVNITSKKEISQQNSFRSMPPELERFFGIHRGYEDAPQQKRKSEAYGSGFIFDDNYILTNFHVVDGATEVIVSLVDRREYVAEIVGVDALSDLAVLKIEANDLIDISLGDSDEARVGEWVMAVGSPFSENLSHTVTTGIISALGRSNIMNSQSYEDFIQTDAAINPGNSGGALISMDGKLIGINTAIATGGSERSNRGVGFAIPSNMVKRIMSDLIDKGFVTRAWLGVFIQELDSETAKGLNIKTRNGALITDVVDGGPAEEGGIQEGDVIIAFNDQLI